jgi:hypothetical protein
VGADKEDFNGLSRFHGCNITLHGYSVADEL